jgi:hypothetical protein
VIVRSNLFASGGNKTVTGYYTKVSFNNIEDGSSNTLVIGEKWLSPSRYGSGDWHDDAGWTGGWDCDILRSTICGFFSDRELNANESTRLSGFRFGGPHSSGMVTGFADGSVHFIRYDLEPRLFNNLGHRSDGSTIEMEAL